MSRKPTISVVVPVYNSQAAIADLVRRVQAVMAPMAEAFEMILVNDGSRDASWKALREAAAANAWVSVIDLGRNYGQHNALLCGIRAARYDVVITIDDDLQHPPEE